MYTHSTCMHVGKHTWPACMSDIITYYWGGSFITTHIHMYILILKVNVFWRKKMMNLQWSELQSCKGWAQLSLWISSTWKRGWMPFMRGDVVKHVLQAQDMFCSLLIHLEAWVKPHSTKWGICWQVSQRNSVTASELLWWHTVMRSTLNSALTATLTDVTSSMPSDGSSIEGGRLTPLMPPSVPVRPC